MHRRATALPGLFALAGLLWPALAPLALAPASARAAEAGEAAPSAAPAADAGGEEPLDLEEIAGERKRRAALYPVRARISRYLSKAAEMVDEEDPDGAQELLDRLSPDRLNPQERALVYRMKAFVAYGAGDYEGAIENFQKVVDEQILPLDAENKVRFNIAQLHASLQQWPEAISAIHEWFRYVEGPQPLAYYLLGIAYFQTDQLDLALENAEKAVDLESDPPEGWIQLLAALYIQKEDYASATPVLEELVIKYPKKAYWVQLSLIYGAREDYRTSLAAQQVAYLQGYITDEKEILRLARGYLFAELPYRAATVIQKGMDDGNVARSPENYELLANSWIQAREYERSIPPLERAAELSPDGNLYVRLAQVNMQREQWADAVDLLQKAIAKGNLKDAGRTRLLLGICYYNDERVARARDSFSQARRFAETKAEADRWIEHIDREASQG